MLDDRSGDDIANLQQARHRTTCQAPAKHLAGTIIGRQDVLSRHQKSLASTLLSECAFRTGMSWDGLRPVLPWNNRQALTDPGLTHILCIASCIRLKSNAHTEAQVIENRTACRSTVCNSVLDSAACPTTSSWLCKAADEVPTVKTIGAGKQTAHQSCHCLWLHLSELPAAQWSRGRRM